MNCPCDELKFPPPLVIPAGLSRLPRQIATFPEFRAAMLQAIGTKPPLKDWRARSSDDFGVMLFEMWSYVCDCVSFYDEVIAMECYTRTTQLWPSLRKLVDLLGYLPRPAVAAKADLAVLAEGRQYITLPRGTAFRSGAFPGGPPQVFELDRDSRVHPFTNQWTLARTRPLTLEPGPAFTASRTSLLLDRKQVVPKPDQLVLVQDLGNSAHTRMRKVAVIDDFPADDGANYKRVTFSQSVPIPGSTPVANLRLKTPAQTGTVFQQPYIIFPTGLIEFFGAYVIFDSLHRQIQLNDIVVLEKSGDFRWFMVKNMGEITVLLPAPGPTTITDPSNNKTTITPPQPQIQVTYIQLDAGFNDSSRREGSFADWTSSDAAYIKVHFGFRTAGIPAVAADITLDPGDPMILIAPVEAPQDGKAPSQYLLQDRDATGVEISASINFPTHTLTPVNPLTKSLIVPVTVYANVVTASRGETVAGEVLGSGDASIPNQAFKLSKSPLTYFSAPDGVVSTLKIYVNGLQWTEKPSFFGVGPDDEVYIVRQNDKGESLITFGDGIRARRLPTGLDNVVAYYRFGAGKPSPPAGSINQMAKPVKDIKSVANPVAASGGDDAEPLSGLRTYAPRSALLLGRAISLPDMEAAAASVAGARAVRAEWRWNELRQRPLVQVWYVGAAPVAQAVIEKLNGLSDSVTPIEVDEAMPVPGTLSMSVQIDPKRIEDQVLAEVRHALMNPETGLLSPEHIGIGLPLFRSRIFESVLSVPGAVAVTGLLWNGSSFDPYGIKPGAGHYFDLESGTLLLNGKAGVNV